MNPKLTKAQNKFLVLTSQINFGKFMSLFWLLKMLNKNKHDNTLKVLA